MKQFLFIGAAALGLLASSASAQTPSLMAGWDFNNGVTFSQSSVVTLARYFESNTGVMTGAGSGNTTAGQLLFNGTAGSDTWAVGSTSISWQTGAGLFDGKRLIDTQTPIEANNELGDLTGNQGSIQFQTTIGSETRNDFAFKVFANGRTLTYIDFTARMGGALNTNQATIDWFYRTNINDASTDSLLATTIAGNTGAFSEFTVDFSALNITSASNIYIIGKITQDATTNPLIIDNFAVYGVIPEPSTYAAFIAAGSLAFVAIRRRKLKK